MNIETLQAQAEGLTEEERAELAKNLMVGVKSRKLIYSTCSEIWVEWAERNVPETEESTAAQRTIDDDIHDIVSEQAILDQSQVQALLDRWFAEVPYLVLSNYDSLEHTAAADPNGKVLMHPLVAVWNGIIGINNAISRGVWADFDEFNEMDDRWNTD